MKIQLLDDKILIKRGEIAKVTPGGIQLPTVAQEKSQEGEVISVGDGKILSNGERRKLVVKVGDKVLFANGAGTPVTVGGEKYLILLERDIWAILK
ncbi:MAG: co-chaperone GroES [Candidatus Heimdallarchaeaceae archaeon]